jgi:hypothetical protein
MQFSHMSLSERSGQGARDNTVPQDKEQIVVVRRLAMKDCLIPDNQHDPEASRDT